MLTIPHQNIIFMWEILLEALEAVPVRDFLTFIRYIYIQLFFLQCLKWIYYWTYCNWHICISHIIALIAKLHCILNIIYQYFDTVNLCNALIWHINLKQNVIYWHPRNTLGWHTHINISNISSIIYLLFLSLITTSH